jgi:hypothetical protein
MEKNKVERQRYKVERTQIGEEKEGATVGKT